MRVALISALGLFLASCDVPVTSREIASAAQRYFELPDKVLVVVSQNARDEEKRRDLAELANSCCTGQLRLRLLRWFSETAMSSDSFFDDVRSMRPVSKPQCQPPTRVDERDATIICLFETSESYSLARNLGDVADLYRKFDVQNMTLADVSSEINSHELPELVELALHVQKGAELHVREVDDVWLVSNVEINSSRARIEVRMPK